MDYHDTLLFADYLCIEFDLNILSLTCISESSRGDGVQNEIMFIKSCLKAIFELKSSRVTYWYSVSQDGIESYKRINHRSKA